MRIALALPLLLASCALAPGDPYREGVWRLERGELLAALRALDQTPPTHGHYAEARILVLAVERRVRRSQELVMGGLDLRAQWRDEEAIRQFESALEIWGDVQGAEDLLWATRNRIAALDPVQVFDPERANGQLIEVPGGDPPAVPDGEVLGGDGPGPPVPLAAELRRARQYASDGDLDGAILFLEEQQLDHPEHQPIRALLIACLHQRALMRYGQGFLLEAQADWTRLLELRPAHRLAREFQRAARAEAEVRGLLRN